MKRRSIAIGAGTAVAALALATWASPHWQLYRMFSAVEARDAAALSRYVDYPKLRESVKRQVMQRLGADSGLEAPGSNPFASFGRAMALAVIDPVVDAAVSPAGVAAMLEAGDIRVQPGQEGPPPAGDAPREKLDYGLSYRNWNQVLVERADGGGLAFVLDRHGLWRWKLAGVELREE
jgi:hypothetical protein